MSEFVPTSCWWQRRAENVQVKVKQVDDMSRTLPAVENRRCLSILQWVVNWATIYDIRPVDSYCNLQQRGRSRVSHDFVINKSTFENQNMFRNKSIFANQNIFGNKRTFANQGIFRNQRRFDEIESMLENQKMSKQFL